MPATLPPKPDFESIEAVAPKSADRRTSILALIGNLVFSWANNESLFIYLLMILLKTDQTSAAIVFATLNTTRARLDLIQRLAKVQIKDRTIAKQLSGLIDRFNKYTRIRNEFNHCMYNVSDRGEITHTHSIRIVETPKQLRLGDVRPMDEARIKEMTEVDSRAKATQSRHLESFAAIGAASWQRPRARWHTSSIDRKIERARKPTTRNKSQLVPDALAQLAHDCDFKIVTRSITRSCLGHICHNFSAKLCDLHGRQILRASFKGRKKRLRYL